MKAMVQEAYGSPKVIVQKEMKVPVPNENEVLLRIQAACVGPSDCAFRKGDPFIIRLIYGWRRPKYPIGGTELAGIVEAVGDGTTLFQPGDRVYGLSAKNFGAHAEYKMMSENDPLVRLPNGVGSEDAVAVSDGGLTALTFLRDKAKLQPGQKVLINGASGAVGVYSVQLAKYFGAHITAVCSGTNADLVKSIGADRVIDYTTTDFVNSGETYDVIFDAVGKRTYSQCKQALKSKGVYMTTVPHLPTILQMIWTSLFNRKRAIFATAGLMQNKANLQFLLERMEEESLKPVIDRYYRLENIADAHTYVETERKKGNVMIIFPGRN